MFLIVQQAQNMNSFLNFSITGFQEPQHCVVRNHLTTCFLQKLQFGNTNKDTFQVHGRMRARNEQRQPGQASLLLSLPLLYTSCRCAFHRTTLLPVCILPSQAFAPLCICDSQQFPLKTSTSSLSPTLGRKTKATSWKPADGLKFRPWALPLRSNSESPMETNTVLVLSSAQFQATYQNLLLFSKNIDLFIATIFEKALLHGILIQLFPTILTIESSDIESITDFPFLKEGP